MRRFFTLATAGFVLTTASAHAADSIGVSMGLLSNNLFQTLIRDSMDGYVKSMPGVTLQVEDAAGDVNKQLDQVRNFISSGATALIVDPADSSATPEISRLAAEAKIPLVYVNIEPANIDKLPPKQVFVGSDEHDSGTMEAKEVCRLLNGKGTVAIMRGDLTTQTAQQRTQDVYDVMKTEPCKGIKVADAQVANWSRIDGANLVLNWMSAGAQLDGIIANNDEMALGAAKAVADSGKAGKIVIGGVDATADGLQALKSGQIAVTVFQDAAGQGKAAIDAALKLAHGGDVPTKVYIPFQLVTRDNMKEFMSRN